MADFSDTTYKPSYDHTFLNPGFSEAIDDTTDRDSATPDDACGAHGNYIYNVGQGLHKALCVSPSELTIAAGVITVTTATGSYRVDTAGDIPSDDLDTINGFADINLIKIRAEHADRTVVIKHGTGNIECPADTDISLLDTNHYVWLYYDSVLTKWVVIAPAAIAKWLQDLDANDFDLTDLGRLNFTAASQLTIAANAVTMTESVHTIETQGAAATDDLDTISGGTEGDILIIYPANAAHTVWITDDGNIDTPGGHHYPIPDLVGALLYRGATNWQLVACGDWRLPEDYTVNLTASNTAAQINAAIAEMPRYIPNDITLTFQFADGTYNSTMTSELLWDGFYGGGTIQIYGNAGDTGCDAVKAVDIDFSAGTSDGIHIRRCFLQVDVSYLDVKVDTAAARYAIYYEQCGTAVTNYNYVHGTNAGFGSGIRINQCPGGSLAYNYVATIQHGIQAQTSMVVSYENDEDAGNQPQYGLYANNAGAIGKLSTQPAGSVANERTAGGGVIR